MTTQIDLNKAWSETTAGTGSGATATHAAATGATHIVTHVSGHSDKDATLQLKDGSTVIGEWALSPPFSFMHFDDDVVATAILLRAGDTLINSIDVHNTTAADAFLLLYDAATTGAVTVGTTVPNYVVPAGANAIVGRSFPIPLFFTAGVVYASTTTTDGDTGAAQDVSIGYSTSKHAASDSSQNGNWVCTPGNAVNAVISGSTSDCQVNIAGFSI
jgi:hypothetical protein